MGKLTNGKVPRETFAGGGEMGRRIRNADWTSTPLGPAEHWQQSLKTSVGIMLNSRYPMFIWWGPHLINLYNDAYIPILGKRHPKALGRPAADTWEDIWDVVGKQAQLVMGRGQSTWNEELCLAMERHGFTEETYFTYSYSPIWDDNGQIGGLFCAVTEDTAKVLARRRLRTLRDLGERTLEKLGDVESACRTAARVLEENPQDIPFALLYLIQDDGRTARLSETVGIKPGSRAAPRRVTLGSEGDHWGFGRLQTAGEPAIYDGIAERFGEVRSTAWPADLVRQAVVVPLAQTRTGEQPSGFLVAGASPRLVLDDEYRSFLNLVGGHIGAAITNARAFEDERQRAAALAELDRAKSEFFSNVSHEFRTPLTLAIGNLEEAAKADSLTEQQRAQIEAAHRNSLRLLKLVNSLLDFSSIEAGQAGLSVRDVDVSAITTDLAGSFRSAIEAAGIKFTVKCSRGLSRAAVDREMWEKIVINLLSNAYKYTFEGEIKLSLTAKAGYVVLEVKDTGVGIPADQIDKIFDRFHRVRSTEGRTFEGTGIGLSLVQELVRLHDGEIAVKSAPGKGSSFTVRIPHRATGDSIEASGSSAAGSSDSFMSSLLASDLAASEQTEDSLAAAPGNVEQEAEPYRVLLVDDNADMREYVGRLLSGHGFRVETARDGRDAIDRARAQAPDLILSDVMMPRMDGFELLAAVRADEKLAAVPFIMLSARAGDESKVDGLDAGADDYLIKPFSRAELIARVTTHIRVRKQKTEAERSISEGSERYRAFIANSSEGIWRFELDEPIPVELPTDRQIELAFEHGYLAECNDAFAKQYGFEKAEDIVGTRLANLLVADDPKNLAFLRAFIESGYRLTDAESHEVDRDGHDRYFLNNFVGLVENECLIRAWGTQRDVTSSKSAAAAIELYKLLLMQARDVILFIRQDNGQIVEANASAAKAYGYELEEFSTLNIRDLRAPGTLEQLREQFDQASRGGIRFETLHRRKDGSIFPVEVDASLATIGSEKYVVSVIRDITDRRESEEALAQNQVMLSLAMQGSRMGVWERDIATGTVWWSDELGAIFGLEKGEFDGTENHFYNLVHEDDRQAAWAEIESAIAEKRSYASEFRFYHSDGSIRWMEGRGEAVYSDDGNPVRIYGVGIDITERKTAEEKTRFLASLDRAMQQHADPDAVMATAARMLCEYLGADRCAYAEVEGESVLVITGDYTRGVPSIVGRWPVSAFGKECERLMLENKPLAVFDVESDDRIESSALPAYRATTTRSLILVPVHKSGVLTAAMTVQQKGPRVWTEREVEVVQTAVNRCWESLERARAARGLRESNDRFQLALSSGAVTVYEQDRELRYKWVYPDDLYSPDVIGKSDLELSAGPDGTARTELKMRVIETGEPTRGEVPAFIGGRVHWYDLSVEPRFDALGNVKGVGGTALDITERKRAQERLGLLTTVSELIRVHGEPSDLLFAVSQAVGEHFRARRCLFNEIDLENDVEIVHRDYCRDVVSVAGSHKISDYSPVTSAEMIAGRTVVNEDSKTDPRTRPFYQKIYEPNGERSYVTVPLLRDSRWVASLWLSDDEPRSWDRSEVSLLETVAERTWTAVEKLRTEESLRESEERLRALVTASSDAIFRMSSDWSEMSQLDGRDFIADTTAPTRGWIDKYISKKDRPSFLAAVERAKRTKSIFELEHRVVRSDGSIGWVLSRAVPLLDERGEIVEWFGTASDVTERREAADALARLQENTERQRRLYDTILSNSLDLAYIFDLDHRFIYANDVLLRMWGKTWDEAIGKNCIELGYPQWHAEMHDREIDEVIATRRPVRGEVPFDGAFGLRIYDYILVPVMSSDGEVEAVVGTTRDVTDIKRRETNAAFLAEISKDLAGLTSINEMMATVAAKIGRHLDLSTCAFVEVDENSGEAIVEYDWHRDDVPGTIGRYQLNEYLTDEFLVSLRAGETFVVNDAFGDPRVDGQRYAGFQIAAFICAPVLMSGEQRFMLCVYDSEPREWRTDEIETLRELSARIAARLEKARSDEAVRESEQNLRRLADTIPQLAWMSHPDGNIFWYNHRWYEYTGTSFERMEGWGWEQVHDPDIAPAVVEQWKHSLDSGEPFEMEFPLRDADGEFRWFLTRANPLRDSKGRITSWFGTNTDIHENRIAKLNAEFLAEIGDQLAGVWDADEIMRTAGEKIGTFFGVAHCLFAEYEPENDLVIVRSDWRRDRELPNMEGTYRLSHYLGDDVATTILSGRQVVVSDVRTDGRTASRAAEYEALNVRSFIRSPFFRQGELKFGILINCPEPRKWRADEADLLRELTSRIWTQLERARAEQQVRYQLDLTETITGNMQTCLLMMDTTGRCTFANHATESVTGFRPDELIGGVLHDKIHNKYEDGRPFPIEECPIDNALPIRESVVGFESTFVHKDGRLYPVRCNARPIFIAGKPIGTVVEVQDITEERRTQDALIEAERRAALEYLDLLERIVPLGQTLGAARDLPAVYRSILGFVRDSMPCSAFFVSFFDAEKSQRTAAYAWGEEGEVDISLLPPLELTRDGGPNSKAVFERRAVIVDRYMEFMHDRPHIIIQENGTDPNSSVAVPMIVMDRVVGTIEVQAYERGAFSKEHVVVLEMVANLAAVAIENVRLLEIEARARTEAEAANRMKDEFLSVLSHELRTPLNAMLGWVRMLRAGMLDAEKSEKGLEVIERNTRQQSSLIEDLLDVSRIISGKMRIEKELLDFAGVVREVADGLRPMAANKGLQFSFSDAAEPAFVEGDAVRLRQVVTNLIQNAVKFTPAGGNISVELSASGGDVSLVVSDTGVGIEQDFLPSIFDRFSQADASTKRSYTGLGLGLTIVSNIVELHGGTVAATSEGRDRGATFTVKIPIANVRATAEESSSNGITARGGKSLRGIRILLIDDDGESVLPLRILLESEQAEVETAGSAPEALEKLASLDFDVIVSDIGMPSVDGYEFIRKLRADSARNRGTTAIALTAYASPDDRARAIDAGFQTHMSKPVNFEELLSAIVASRHPNGPRNGKG